MKVFTNGCFDVLHRGHLELLKYCSELACPAMGGWVIVGLNSDDSIKKLKGESRPVNNQEDRKFALESLVFVDKVLLFEEDNPRKLIKEIKPDCIVKGGDHRPEAVIGSDLCNVKIFKYLDGYSSTKLIENHLSC